MVSSWKKQVYHQFNFKKKKKAAFDLKEKKKQERGKIITQENWKEEILLIESELLQQVEFHHFWISSH